MRPILADVGTCIAFYTRLPMGRWGGGELGPASWATPLAGIVVGASGGCVFVVADVLGLPPMPAAALSLAGTMLMTGALHEDGLADTADGLGGGRTRERKLEVMRDSRLGTYGACALLLSLLLRWSALASLAEPVAVAATLVVAHAAARAPIPAFMRWTPWARGEGLARAAGTPPLAAALVSLAIGVGMLLTLGAMLALAAIFLLLCWSIVLRRRTIRQIGGQTGDVLGCLEQGGEMLVLLTAAALARG